MCLDIDKEKFHVAKEQKYICLECGAFFDEDYLEPCGLCHMCLRKKK